MTKISTSQSIIVEILTLHFHGPKHYLSVRRTLKSLANESRPSAWETLFKQSRISLLVTSVLCKFKHNKISVIINKYHELISVLHNTYISLCCLWWENLRVQNWVGECALNKTQRFSDDKSKCLWLTIAFISSIMRNTIMCTAVV